MPPEHGVPDGHTFPQVPQLLGSVLVSTHDPPHWVRGGVHITIGVHMPALHDEPDGQTFPHIPQLFGSELVFTHAVPHVTLGGGHGVPHTPPVQLAPSGHLLPHAPQLLVSVDLSTHVPLHRSGVGEVQLDTQVCDDELQNVLVGHVTAFAQVVPHDVLLLRSLHTPPQLT